MKEKTQYNVWPVGKLPKEWQRTELDDLSAAGYHLDDPRDAVDIFEKKLAEFAGSKYAVTVDCCSNGLILALKYYNAKGVITIPSRTYVSTPMQILHAGCQVQFEDYEWSGVYHLSPYPIVDGAVRFTKDMYVPGTLHVVSFQIKKRLPIGRGGVILTDNEEEYRWLKKASYDGRDLTKAYMDDEFEMIGYHMYMTPEDAARGILIMDQLPLENEDTGCSKNYSNLSTKKVFMNHDNVRN